MTRGIKRTATKAREKVSPGQSSGASGITACLYLDTEVAAVDVIPEEQVPRGGR